MIWTLTQYALTAAFRDKLFISFLAIVAVGISLSIFTGSSAIIEKDQFSTVFAAGGLRMAGVMGLVLFIVFYIRRSFDHRDIDFLLSRPVSRITFVLSHSLAFTVLAAFMAFVIFTSVYLSVPQKFHSGHMLWSVSLLIEFVIVTNIAFFFSMVLPSATMAALGVFGFYVFSRMIGHIMGIMEATPGYEMLDNLLSFISIFIPRLDLMGQTAWLLYGAEGGTGGLVFIIFQGVVFSTLVILATMIDLTRRQF